MRVSLIIIILLIYERKIIASVNNSNHQQLLTLDKICMNNDNYTIKAKVEPILCPMISKSKDDYICHRIISNTHTSYNQSEYKTTKLYWQNLFHKFDKHLRNQTVFFLGDSLSYQMLLQLHCLEEFTNLIIHNKIIEFENYGFPTRLNSSIYEFTDVSASIIQNAVQQKWYYSIRSDSRIKYLVVNTGMWWNPNHFLYLHNNSLINNEIEILKIYEEYFRRDGLFLQSLYDLIHNYNVTVLWRDTAPTGSCNSDKLHAYNKIIKSKSYPYHRAFTTMNIIARKALKDIGALIIPDIWEESLPYWDLHLENDTPHTVDKMDLTHYCLFGNQSIYNLWIQKTISLILEN